MSKTMLATAASWTVAGDGSLAGGETWIPTTGLIDTETKHEINFELKFTFNASADVTSEVYVYRVGSTDGTDVTSSVDYANPLAVITPVQSTTITVVLDGITGLNYRTGLAFKNTDSTYAVGITCYYKTTTY
jgi:hypothetical protein